MIKKAFLLKLFDAANMRRWNDKICPVDLRELDKQAHKMIITYVLGKIEEEYTEIDWMRLIEGGIFEFLQRIVVTDIKPEIFHRIKDDRGKYKKLNEWILNKLQDIISGLGDGFKSRFINYFEDQEDDVHKKILSAAHFYATKWEFEIIRRTDPEGYGNYEIRKDIEKRLAKNYELEGMKKLIMIPGFGDFVDLCGELRFQVRWSHLYRVPRTSVLGHMFIVAILSYLFSLEMDLCNRKKYNNFFTGLFHDLPELLTRDIIYPVKKSIEGLEDLIKAYEKEKMEKRIFKLLPAEWKREIWRFTSDEFKDTVYVNGSLRVVTHKEIRETYNEDKYNPRDGSVVEGFDLLTAFIEAYLALKNGIRHEAFENTKTDLKQRAADLFLYGKRFSEFYSDFD